MMSGPFSGGENVDFSGVCAANANLSFRRAFACGTRPAPGKALTGRCFRLYIRALAGAATGLGFGVQTSLKPALTASDASRLAPSGRGDARIFATEFPMRQCLGCFMFQAPLLAGAGERQNASPPCIQAMCRQNPLCAAFRKIYGINLDASFYLRGVAFCGAFTGARPAFMEFRIMAWDASRRVSFLCKKAEPCPPEGEKRAVVYTGGMVMDACISVVKLAALCRRLCVWRRRLQNSNPEAGERPRGADCFKRRAMGPLRRRPGPPRQYGPYSVKFAISSAPRLARRGFKRRPCPCNSGRAYALLF